MSSERLRHAATKIRELARPIAAWVAEDRPLDDEHDELQERLRQAGFEREDVALAVADWFDTEVEADAIPLPSAVRLADLILGPVAAPA